MHKYIIYFTTQDGDSDKEWCYANSQAEAESILLHEHWNVKRIDTVIRED